MYDKVATTCATVNNWLGTYVCVVSLQEPTHFLLFVNCLLWICLILCLTEFWKLILHEKTKNRSSYGIHIPTRI